MMTLLVTTGIVAWVGMAFLTEAMFVWYMQREYPSVTGEFWEEFDWAVFFLSLIIAPFIFATSYFKWHRKSR